jgi:hypothetical protein
MVEEILGQNRSYFTLTSLAFDGVLYITAFRIHKNCAQSTQKSCVSLHVLFEVDCALECHLFVTISGRNGDEHVVLYFAVQ